MRSLFPLLALSLLSLGSAQPDPTPALPQIIGLTTYPTPTPSGLLKVPIFRRDCAASLIATSSVTGTGTLPKPTSFVRKNETGQNLILNGETFRVAGANIYWLCNDQNVLPVGAPPDKARVREALAIAVAMGANTIRIPSCATSVGFKYAIEPNRSVFAAPLSPQWDARDYAIWAAGEYGLRVVMPLTSDYAHYFGGKYNFLEWRNVSTANQGALFWTDPGVISDFQTYIKAFLLHQNPYNGKTYAQDRTIFAWETGNEFGAYEGWEGYPPANWTACIAEFIKRFDPNHLVIDGSDGFLDPNNNATAPGLGVAAVDIMTDHSYPRQIALLESEVPLATAANKNFLIGEFDWTNLFGGDNLTSYLTYLESQDYYGSLVWSVFGHDSQCCNYVQHNDSYTIYYPNGNSDSDQGLVLQVVQHFHRLSGREVPTELPGVACPQPVF